MKASNHNLILLVGYSWLLSHSVSSRTPGSFSAKLLSSWVPPECRWFSGILPPHMQDFAHLLAELHETFVSPPLQPVQVPLDGSTTLWHFRSSSQFLITCKLAKGTLCPTIQVINDVEYLWSHHQPLGYTSSKRLASSWTQYP